jgi:hypothetical protein
MLAVMSAFGTQAKVCRSARAGPQLRVELKRRNGGGRGVCASALDPTETSQATLHIRKARNVSDAPSVQMGSSKRVRLGGRNYLAPIPKSIRTRTDLVAGAVEIAANRLACAAEMTREKRLGDGDV